MADNARKVPPADASAPSIVFPALAALIADIAAPGIREAPQLPLSTLDATHGRSRLLVQLLHNRGISGSAAIESFLAANWHSSGPPLLHLDRAVARIHQAVARGERIVVYGDFDCDGVTSCALLALAIREIGGSVETYVPKRDDDGRGLNMDAVRKLAAAGVRLIVTTDCGTANVEETELARSLNMDVIVTDHHPPHGPLAPAYAIVNPRQEGDTSGEEDLAGVGVAFRLAQALLADTAAGSEQRVNALLDLVAIGTIADVVPLTPMNWALVRAGLQRIHAGPRPGVRALLDAARVDAASMSARDVSFALAPRLNACGRMEHPDWAVQILMMDDQQQARELAQRIEELNLERQSVTDQVLMAARAQAEGQRSTQAALVAVGDGWPLGILGLVAGRLADEYRRPAFAISRGARECRGSARGAAGVNLGELLAERPGIFKRFGGHAQAAGFTLATSDLDAFLAYVRERFAVSSAELRAASDAAAANGSDTQAPREIAVDCRLRLSRLASDSDVYDDLAALEPFGPGFAEPVFLTPGLRIASCWRSGVDGRTLRVSLSDGHGTKREAIWTRRGEFCDRLRALLPTLPPLDVAYTLRAYRTARGEPAWRPHIETVAIASGHES